MNAGSVGWRCGECGLVLLRVRVAAVVNVEPRLLNETLRYE